MSLHQVSDSLGLIRQKADADRLADQMLDLVYTIIYLTAMLIKGNFAFSFSSHKSPYHYSAGHASLVYARNDFRSLTHQASELACSEKFHRLTGFAWPSITHTSRTANQLRYATHVATNINEHIRLCPSRDPWSTIGPFSGTVSLLLTLLAVALLWKNCSPEK